MSAVGDATTYATALLEAIARDEAAGRRGARLTERGQATWQRFRGRLGSADLLRLLAADGAVVHPIPFASGCVGVSLDDLEGCHRRSLPGRAALEGTSAAREPRTTLVSDKERERIHKRVRCDAQMLGRLGKCEVILAADSPFVDEAGIVLPFEYFEDITLAPGSSATR